MADVAKYTPINGGTLYTDFKSHFSLFKTKKTLTCAYAFVFIFIAFTIFIAFSPSSNSTSPLFSNIFTTNFTSTIPATSSNGSHFSPFFSYFFPNSSNQLHNSTLNPSQSIPRYENNTSQLVGTSKNSSNVNNQTQNSQLNGKNAIFNSNQTESTQLNGKAPNLEPNQTHLNGKFANMEPNQTQLNGKNAIFEPNQTENTQLNGKVANMEANQSQLNGKAASFEANQTQLNGKFANIESNQTDAKELKSKNEILKANQSSIEVSKSPNSFSEVKNGSKSDKKSISEKGLAKNLTSSLNKKPKNERNNFEDLVKSLLNCDLYDGNWVKDDSYPLYKPNSCSLIDEQFNCFRNGRPDHDYYQLKWKPRGCTIPRLNGTHMLELLRGKRLAYVGDSLNRNMWESLVCILRNSVKDQKKVYEVNGRMHFRGEASYAFIFEDYNLRVEFYVSPFLVQEWEVTDKSGTKKERLRLDLVGHTSEKYKNADFIIFNTGHWWTHEKTSLGKDYYQEGSHVYSELNVLEAFRKALTTWAKFVDANVNPSKTHVMFRGYSASHFSGGQWNSGGQCDHETQPIKNETYLTPYPPMMTVMEKVLKNMKVHVSYLNITRLTDYRKDGHPSMYRKQHLSQQEMKSPLRFQDCSHWCLPGVPDSWNELLYAELLVKMVGKTQ
ncbi:hypothetical protein LIER_01610 [Lithospermum erythrorhizon]|uniref:Trichome birefringence-like N-terminal domain-containing protein n=1 Tax=Lithospermum erythrorhizon TaxID=34254 RepID=A0AAV3NR41_LITER